LPWRLISFMELEKIRQEFNWSVAAKGAKKDILIVVHNQHHYIRKCLESIFKNTRNFDLHIWDNGSDVETANYLKAFAERNSNVNLRRNESNIGFIVPNNIMAKDAKSDWLILLNSDTEVMPSWDEVLVGFLMNNQDVLQAGFLGGILNERGVGCRYELGGDVDYVCGYCFCISRSTYERFGLFDDQNLKFAYCEDSDLSLRIKDAGGKVYACFSTDLVVHYGHKTTLDVLKKQKEVLDDAMNNRLHIVKKWFKFLPETLPSE